jgi:hypothetical protein
VTLLDKLGKMISILMFTGLGLVVFPYAVLTHQHLYADGSFYFAQIIETGSVFSYPARFFGNAILELPTLFALKIGIINPETLSIIYGASLYYLPFFCYIAAALLLFRKGMSAQATLLGLMYTILVYFTSFFIISESHLSTGLFILVISIITTCNMQKVIPLLALLCISTIALLSYQFWVIFFPVCIVYFLFKVIGQDNPFYIRLIQIIIVFVFIGGSIVNLEGVLSSDFSAVRDDMLSVELFDTWQFNLAACLLFGSAILYSSSHSILVYVGNLGRRINGNLRFPITRRLQEPLHWVAFLGILGSFIFLYTLGIPKPYNAYPLRSLNLFLPLLFLFSLVVLDKKTHNSISAHFIAVWGILPMAILVFQTCLYTTSGWQQFQSDFFIATQERTGFISIEDVPAIKNSPFLWGWTSPTLSILFQTMEGKAVQSIIYNPDATWQPYGPQELKNAAILTGGLNGIFIIRDFEN